ncbi:hypothetical protein COP2_025377 [Malus domestica]
MEDQTVEMFPQICKDVVPDHDSKSSSTSGAVKTLETSTTQLDSDVSNRECTPDIATEPADGDSDLIGESSTSKGTEEGSPGQMVLPVLQKITDLTTEIQDLKREHTALSVEVKLTTSSFPDPAVLNTIQLLSIEHKLLKKKYLDESSERKRLYNEMIELKGNIRVFCRCRPLNQTEISSGSGSVVEFESSLTAAVQSLNAGNRYASFQVVGYLVEELRDADTYKMFCQDLEDANIFIGSLIFVEELAIKVKEAVEKQRDRMDAVLVFPSMPEVMRLNKLGSFSMSQLGQSKSPFFQLFKRKKQSPGFADSMLKLVRTLPKVLKYLPSDKAQDARLYILSLQFWLGGSPDNLQNFVKMISGSYVPALKGKKIPYSDPVLFLDTGIWHPLAPCMYDDVKEYLNWYGTRKDANEKLKSPNAPVVGLILQRSHIVTGDESHYVAVIMGLEARGAKVIPIFFAGGLDFSGPVERFLIDPVTKKPFIHSAISLTGFALVGGPARQDHPRAVEALMKLDVPYIVALPLVFQTTEEWLNSTLGLHPIQVFLHKYHSNNCFLLLLSTSNVWTLIEKIAADLPITGIMSTLLTRHKIKSTTHWFFIEEMALLYHLMVLLIQLRNVKRDLKLTLIKKLIEYGSFCWKI